MKKLVLRKDIIARINNVEMNQLRGGGDSNYVCLVDSNKGYTCDGANTCNTCNQFTCPHNLSCGESCTGTCTPTCVTCPATCVTTSMASCEQDCSKACSHGCY